MDISKLIKQSTGTANKILLYGSPATGKTTAALTWPNPLVLNFDNNLRSGVAEIPFWSAEFIDSIAKRTHPAHPPNRRDALRHILRSGKFDASQTVIVDSLTRVQSAYDMQENAEPPPLTKSGQIDTLKLFRLRLAFFDEMLSLLGALPCTVICIAHQQFERDDDGNQSARVKPMLGGQAGDRLPAFFSMVLQTVVQQQEKTKEPMFMFRVRPSAYAPARVSINKPITTDFIPANYKALTELMA